MTNKSDTHSPIKESIDFEWTEEGYQQELYCYYCKAEKSESNKINHGGYGCTNCKNYAERS